MDSKELLNAMQQDKEAFSRIENILDGRKCGIKKTCPFCGSEEIVILQYKHDVGLRYSVFCCGCTAGIDPGWAQELGCVVEMWNKRTSQN